MDEAKALQQRNYSGDGDSQTIRYIKPVFFQQLGCQREKQRKNDQHSLMVKREVLQLRNIMNDAEHNY